MRNIQTFTIFNSRPFNFQRVSATVLLKEPMSEVSNHSMSERHCHPLLSCSLVIVAGHILSVTSRHSLSGRSSFSALPTDA